MHRLRAQAAPIVLGLTAAAFALLAGRSLAAGPRADGAEVRAALDQALAVERRALAFCEAAGRQFGQRPPFAEIRAARQRDLPALLEQYDRFGLEPPPAPQPEAVRVPAQRAEACDAAEAAARADITRYDHLIAQVSDPGVRAVFQRLRAGTAERDLPAFQRHGGGWRTVSPDDLSAGQRSQMESATQARNEVYQRLMARLGQQMAAGGPAAAIGVCRQEAPQITATIGQRHGVRIGRTSWKLRNPANVGPPWTWMLLRDRPAAPRLATARDGRLGVTLPIRVTGRCLTCHGPVGSMTPAVRGALREDYPQDEAVGFGDGDLRGWFWVEVPAEATQAVTTTRPAGP